MSQNANNINGSINKNPSEGLLDSQQEDDFKRQSEPQLIRGKYDLVADWKQPEYNTKKCLQGWRLGIFIGCIPFILIPVYLYGPIYMFTYATQWGIQLLCYTSLLQYLATRRPNSYCLNAASCIVGQLSIGFNYVTMCGYWTVVAPEYMPLAPNVWWKIGLVLSHTLPTLIQVILIALADCRIVKADVWQFIVFATFYIFLNWVISDWQGEPIYPFMTWKSWKTPFYAECYVAVGSVCYLITAWGIDYFKGERQLKRVLAHDQVETQDNNDIEYQQQK